MLSLEQVKLLESKVTGTIEYVKKVSGENLQLKERLTSYQKRIEELEVLVQQFKENQSKIEDGILSALDRLNQFEDALESKLSSESKHSAEGKPSVESKAASEAKPPVETKPQPSKKAAQEEKEEKESEIDGELDSPPEQCSEELSSEESSSGEQSFPQELDIF